jgi:hypothetical protein
MKTTTVSLIALLVPAALCAQVSGQAGSATTAKTGGVSAASTTQASASGEFKAPSSFSAEGAAKLDAMYAEAKEHHVPREPMARRVAEGHAKAASEETIIASAGKVKVREEATQEAMVAGGRKKPSDEEIDRGASAMERGVTKAQIQAIAKSSQGDRSLVVAFDVLAKLAARGVPVGQAVAQVQSNITSGASDAALSALVTTSGNTNGANAAANANGAVSGTTKPLGGTVSTSVGGVLKKP